MEEDISYILGHKKNQTQRYGSIPAKEFSNRINKVKYKLDFKQLEKNGEQNKELNLNIAKNTEILEQIDKKPNDRVI